jgi:DNA repair exonuclease SbcCD ATPase subunit
MIDYVEVKHPLFSDNDVPTKIFFNPNLTCIIGGKSTGKSLLLNNIAYAVDSEQVIKKYNITQPENKKKGNNGLFTPLDGFVVHWSDGSKSSSPQSSKKKIVFIPQTYLNRLSDEREETTEIDEIIKEILMQNEDIKACYEKCQVEMEELKKHTDKIIYDYVNVLNKIHICQKQLLDNNNSKTIQKEISKLEKEQKQYAALAQISEDQSNLYNAWCQEFQSLNTKQSYLMHDKQVLLNETHILMPLPTTLRELQSDIKDQMNEFLQQLQVKINQTWILKQKEFISSIDKQSTEINDRKAELAQKIKKIQHLIENNANYINISKKITNEKKKLLIAEKTENDLAKLQQTLSDLLMQLVQNVNKYHNILENYAKHVNDKDSLKVEGLEFKLEVVLRVDALKDYLLEVLNNKTLSRFKDIDISKFDLNCYTVENLKKLIISIQENNLTSLELKSQYSFENVLRGLLSNWYNINYVVTMDNDNLDSMSPGKKALVLLKLLIGLAESDCPMLIDQPEDDLDNRSIFDDLVKYIKSKKTERQIIIVTHNANIVVGADSEEVIVANQDGQNTPNKKFQFEYISGAIEDNWINKNDPYVLSSQGIQQHICDILEGGRSAFDKRNKKYDFIRQPIKP